MSQLWSPTIERLLDRGSRSWADYHREEIVSRVRFNAEYIDGMEFDKVREYKALIDEIDRLLRQHLSEQAQYRFWSTRRRRETLISQKIQPLLTRLQSVVAFPRRETIAERGSGQRQRLLGQRHAEAVSADISIGGANTNDRGYRALRELLYG
jgi:hypothetical protein